MWINIYDLSLSAGSDGGGGGAQRYPMGRAHGPVYESLPVGIGVGVWVERYNVHRLLPSY
jgi:hypothetical protein